jgi:hypothetical protein
MFDILTDDFPDGWNLEGKIYKIKTDFRNVLKFFKVIKKKGMTEREKACTILDLFFYEIPDTDKVWEFLGFWINGGETKKDEGVERKVFDFIVDSGRIYAAFMQSYNIDLTSQQMHWFKFLELMQNIPDDTRLMQVIDIRSRKPAKGDSKEYIRELRKMQNRYKIDDEEEKQNTLTSFLMGGW